MPILLVIALTASVAALAWLGGRASARATRRAWLAPVLQSLSTNDGSRALGAILSDEVAPGIDASHVEWWHRDSDDSYGSRLGRIVDADARVLDAWIGVGGTWRRDAAPRAPGDEVVRTILASTGAELVVAVRDGARALGLLAVGGRPNGEPYAAGDVGDLEALAQHLALVLVQRETRGLLDEARGMLQQATRLSTVGTLAAELAHEIRNPLVAVQTFLQILPERLDDPEVTVDLRGVALTELQRVARLLNELLGMARASVATFTPTDLELVVEQVVRLLQVSARKKEVVLERRGEILPVGAADASRLKQALVNLVLNAIQASPSGKTVWVETRTTAGDNGAPCVEVAVHDEGPGVPEEQRDDIFQPFVTTKENGTGLGLPVTRQIVADHGGSIAVEDGVGGGVVFVVRLPLVLPSTEQRDQAA